MPVPTTGRPRMRHYGVLLGLTCLYGCAPPLVHSSTRRAVPFRPHAVTSRPAHDSGQDQRNSDVIHLTQSVLDRLIVIAPAGQSAQYAAWPPRLEIITGNGADQGFEGVGKYNAFASAPRCIPMIGITDGLLRDLIENDSDRLALVFGHELSHILLGHTTCQKSAPRTAFVRVAFTRDQEYAADKNGVMLMQKAGFSAHSGLRVLELMDTKFGGSSFEALGADHPSMKDRLAAIDIENAPLWRSMSAFDTGVFFLSVEQFAPAEDCFAEVVKAYPDAAEAWLNLGYARLMRYADSLATDDIERLGFGHVVAGSFARYPGTLAAKVRGINTDLWEQAVSALRRAAALKPDSAMVKENLGIAYLVSPHGPVPDTAIPFLTAALQVASNQKPVDPSLNAGITINLAVARSAEGNMEQARELLEAAHKDCQQLEKNSPALYFSETAIRYNYAFSMDVEKSPIEAHHALEMLASYLALEDPESAWWPAAFKRYQKIAAAQGVQALAADEIRRSSKIPRRPLVSLQIDRQTTLTLGRPLASVTARIGKGVEIPIDAGGKLRRIRYSAFGVDLIGDANLLAISLYDAAAPAIQLQPFGVTSKGDSVRVGMQLRNLRDVLGDEPCVRVAIIDPSQPFYFFPYLGAALRVGEDMRISEIVLAQIPLSK